MSNVATVNPAIKPGLYLDIPNESYHAGPGISKSGLWTIATKTPAHFKFGEREARQHFDFGEAVHLAILQPDLAEQKITRGPDDRRGNKWKDALEWCADKGKLLLTSSDYDEVFTIRDAVHADATINSIITGGQKGDTLIEASAFAVDPVTGELRRCRPDLYRRDVGLGLDVKTAVSAHPDAFAKATVNYGYHAQEAFYSDILVALDQPLNGFVFLAIEKETPYAFALYELPPAIVEEGRVMMRKALDLYAECKRDDHWPAYGAGVQELAFKRWAYRLTEAPAEEAA